ncbi:MAG: 50S ribosomal protein L25 [Planctomycetota bacterium]|nr:MAG: 50S ribosomal protein L25 [Planctomycetota bacterium]
MSTAAIAATPRTTLGRRASAAFRKQGQVPAVIMRSGQPSSHILVNAIAADQLLKSRVHTCVVTLEGIETTVLIRDADRNCLNDSLVHIDFLEVDATKSVDVEVPLRPITLACPGIKAGGLLEQMVRKIKIRCPVSQIPDDIAVDLGNVGISETFYARQLVLPEGISLLTPERTALMSVLKTRAMKKAEAGK